MKTFLAAALFFAAAVAVSGFVYESVGYSATEAYSMESARVGHDAAVDGRLGWAVERDEAEDG